MKAKSNVLKIQNHSSLRWVWLAFLLQTIPISKVFSQALWDTASPIPQHRLAQEELPNPVMNQARGQLRTWAFNVQGAPWSTILREFAGSMGFSLSMGVQPAGTFTYFDGRYHSPQQAIDIFNDHLIPLGAILVRNEDRLILVSSDVPIADSIVPFVAVNEIDSVGRNEVAGAAIPMKGTDAQTALAEVMAMKSGIGTVRAFSNTGRVMVIDTGTHLRRIRDLLLQTGFARNDDTSVVYQLRHAKAEDVAKAIQEFLTGQTGGADGQFSSQTGQNDRVVAEKTTNSLIIRGSVESMPTIYRIICDLDRFPREVLLQALIVEVNIGNTNELGIELGIQDSVLFDRSIVNNIQTVNQTLTSPNGVQTTDQRILSQSTSPGFAFNGAPLGNNAVNPGRIGTQGFSNLGAGRMNSELGFGGLVLSAGSESVSALLRALDAKFKVDVLSRPQIRTVENKEAFIQIGQQVPVVDGVTVNAVGSANPVIRQDKAGIILKTTPRISPDGRVQIDVMTEKSAFLLARGSGVPIFTDTTTGRVIEAPVKDITTATTTVSIQTGETVVLGGMISNSENVVHRKVPFLGDIPLLGRLFRYDLEQHSRKELLVFLTPVVLNDDISRFHMEDEISRTLTTPKAGEYLNRWQQNQLAPNTFCPPSTEQFGPNHTQATEALANPQSNIGQIGQPPYPLMQPSIPRRDSHPDGHLRNFVPTNQTPYEAVPSLQFPNNDGVIPLPPLNRQ
jgi:type II secretory pathway component GspD/PulD (secretin)